MLTLAVNAGKVLLPRVSHPPPREDYDVSPALPEVLSTASMSASAGSAQARHNGACCGVRWFAPG